MMPANVAKKTASMASRSMIVEAMNSLRRLLHFYSNARMSVRFRDFALQVPGPRARTNEACAIHNGETLR